MTVTPTIVRAGDPDDVTWEDDTRGRVVFQTRIDAAAGPTSGLVLGTARIEDGDAEAPHHHNVPEVVFVPAGIVHSWRSEGEALQTLYAFPTDSFNEVEYHWAAAA